jgi:hypothetical protein
MTSNEPPALAPPVRAGVRPGQDLELRLSRLEQRLRYWQLATLWCVGALAVYSCKTSGAITEPGRAEPTPTVQREAPGLVLAADRGEVRTLRLVSSEPDRPELVLRVEPERLVVEGPEGERVIAW